MNYDYVMPFDWSTCFVADRSTDCMPACIAMAARYWKQQIPSSNIPSDLNVWKKFITDLKGTTMRGASLSRVMKNLERVMQVGKPSENIQIKRHNMINVESTIEFLKHKPAIPLIMVFDRSYMVTNNEGGYHACLLYGVDYKKEKKISLIDPSSIDLQEPFPWDLERFSKGWDKMQNLCLAVYPPDVSQISTKKDVRAKSITGYVKEYQ